MLVMLEVMLLMVTMLVLVVLIVVLLARSPTLGNDNLSHNWGFTNLEEVTFNLRSDATLYCDSLY